MTVGELIVELAHRGVKLSAQGGELKVSAPRGALDAQLRARLSEHKRALLERVAEPSAGSPRASIPLVPRTAPIPLSPAQERMWFLRKLESELALFNVPIAARLFGALDEALFARCLAQLIERHEILRTRYELRDGTPVQCIEPGAGAALVVSDASGLDADAQASAIQRLVRAPADAPGQAIQIGMLRLSPRERVFAVTLRDVALDGWSRGVFVGELARLYAAQRAGQSVALPALPVQYADFCAWQARWLEGPEAREQLDWWREELAGLPRAAGVLPDHARPRTRQMRARLVPIRFSPQLVAGLRTWASAAGATPYAALLAAFALVASRRSGLGEVVVGAPVANRMQPELAGVLGFFANNLVLRLRLAGVSESDALLARVRDCVAAAMRRQAIPLEHVAEQLELPRAHQSTPLFQVLVALNVATPRPELEGLRMEALPADEVLSRFDLELVLEEADGAIAGWFKYDVQLFERDTIEGLARDLIAVAAALPQTRTLADVATPHVGRPVAQPDPAKAPRHPPRALCGPTEQALAGLFEALLHTQVTSSDADFLALGGSSLLATRLALLLRERLGVELPLQELLAHPSVGELAALIDAQAPAALPVGTPLLPLRRARGGQNVFVLPPGIGSPACYADLDWPDDVSVWGAQLPGLFGERALRVDIAQLAAEWCDAIVRVQPRGPYALLGWSLGGLLALELAAELEARGCEVDLLCLIDGGPLPGAEAPWWQSWARAPAGLGTALRVWADVRMPERAEFSRWLRWCGLGPAEGAVARPSVPAVRALSLQAARVLRAFALHVHAAGLHRPRGCAAPILLIRAEQRRERGDALLRRVRARTTGGVQLLHSPGNHMSMMLDPAHRRQLSALLAGRLALRAAGSSSAVHARGSARVDVSPAREAARVGRAHHAETGT